MSIQSLSRHQVGSGHSLPALRGETAWLVAMAIVMVAVLGLGVMALPDANEPIDSPAHWSRHAAPLSP